MQKLVQKLSIWEKNQVTKCDGIYLSSPKPLTISVPQGSTLGPLLFILYVSDLSYIKHVFDVKLKMYADDTVIYAHGKTVDEIQQSLQSCLNYVYKWCIINRLYMNMKKTKIMWFERSNRVDVLNTNYSINVEGVDLSRGYNYMYLGVDLDHMLSYDSHLDSVVNKTTQKL